jgi:hypothetical protein
MKNGLNKETMERGCVADQPQHTSLSRTLRLAFSTVALRDSGFTAPCFIRVQSVAKQNL